MNLKYMNGFEYNRRPNIDLFEKSELINFALHKQRLFFINLMNSNIFIHPDLKMEMHVNLDCIFYFIYNKLMDDINDYNILVDGLKQEGYAVNFLEFCKDNNLFNTDNINDIILNQNI